MKLLNDSSKWSSFDNLLLVLITNFILFSSFPVLAAQNESLKPGYLGSSQCRSCHERFYQLWGSSHHGLAMQPYTESFAKKKLKPQLEEIVIGSARYRAVIDEGPGFVIESKPAHQKKYAILHVLGGKNVYYFLTELERGHLQTLPVAYDVQSHQWFDTAASGVRHFPDSTDEAVHWTDRAYTFNTSCYGCHVSQLVKNYDLKADAYNTQWKEPGINCETCHGPADGHVQICLEAGEGNTPKDLKLKAITQSRGFTSHQVNTACSTCHAKGMPITSEFVPGEDFFQHSDLVTLEHQDFYPDGRDLGENYTYTTWRMSPCVQSGKLDCMHCHTSSGRFRFKDKPNDACTSCHSEKVKNFKEHTHHENGTVTCLQCHMPITSFARMKRSDHSMRPPMPSATLQFQSPNACNICHQDKDAKWADGYVREWHKIDYQKPTLEIATLVNQARKNDWKNLSEMLAYLQTNDRDEIFANSLIRLMRGHIDPRIGAILTELVKDDPSPLIRSSAADGLELYLSETTIPVLSAAANDPFRLVRVRAIPSLAPVPENMIPADLREPVPKASEEYITAMNSRPDDAMSYYNLGNYYAAKRQKRKAIQAYETSIRLRNDFIQPYVNVSMAYNSVGNNDAAAKRLQQAITLDPNSNVAHLNLGMLYSEMGRFEEAITEFKTTFKLDSHSAAAAYNLCVLSAEKDLAQALAWAQKAFQLQPQNPKYAYTYAFYLYRANRIEEVIPALEPFVKQQTTEVSIYYLLGQIYEQNRDVTAATRVYNSAAQNPLLSDQIRSGFKIKLQELK